MFRVYITTHTSGIYATDGSYTTFDSNILITTLVCLLNCVNMMPLRTLGVVVLLGIIVAYGARGPLICIVISLGLDFTVQICFFFCLEKNHTVLFLYRWRIWSVHGKEYNY